MFISVCKSVNREKRINFIWTLSATTWLARDIKNNQCTISYESYLMVLIPCT